jgi:hypothetical protein
MKKVKKKVAVITPQKSPNSDATNPSDKVSYNDLVWRGEEDPKHSKDDMEMAGPDSDDDKAPISPEYQ